MIAYILIHVLISLKEIKTSIDIPDEDLGVFVAVDYYCVHFDYYCVPNYRLGSDCCLDTGCYAVGSNE